jgi:hypothetical protein
MVSGAHREQPGRALPQRADLAAVRSRRGRTGGSFGRTLTSAGCAQCLRPRRRSVFCTATVRHRPSTLRTTRVPMLVRSLSSISP